MTNLFTVVTLLNVVYSEMRGEDDVRLVIFPCPIYFLMESLCDESNLREEEDGGTTQLMF